MSSINNIQTEHKPILVDVTCRNLTIEGTVNVPIPPPPSLGQGVIYENESGNFVSIPIGTEGQVLTMVSGDPEFADISSSEIPDPLLVNTINERTLNTGTTINGTLMRSIGMKLITNTYPGFGSTYLSTYTQSGVINMSWIDSANSEVVANSQLTATKIGNVVTIRFSQVNSTNTLSAGASYLICSYSPPNGYYPFADADLCAAFPMFGGSDTVGSGSVFVVRYVPGANQFWMGNYGTSNFGFGSIGNGQTIFFHGFNVTYLTS